MIETLVVFALVFTDCVISSVVDNLWGSLYSVKVLVALQLILHALFLIASLILILPALKGQGRFTLSGFKGIALLWFVRLLAILAAHFPRIQYEDVSLYWDKGGLQFLVLVHLVFSCLLYRAVLKLSLDVKRSWFCRI